MTSTSHTTITSSHLHRSRLGIPSLRRTGSHPTPLVSSSQGRSGEKPSHVPLARPSVFSTKTTAAVARPKIQDIFKHPIHICLLKYGRHRFLGRDSRSAMMFVFEVFYSKISCHELLWSVSSHTASFRQAIVQRTICRVLEFTPRDFIYFVIVNDCGKLRWSLAGPLRRGS